jgi:hypothetical protein
MSTPINFEHRLSRCLKVLSDEGSKGHPLHKCSEHRALVPSTDNFNSILNMGTTSTPPTSKFSTMSSDDSFQLYDLRVEVICPPGAKILCGAKEGDHFTLEGEMLRLPASQGISIYSLCLCSHQFSHKMSYSF